MGSRTSEVEDAGVAAAADGAGVGATDGAADGGAIDGAVEAGADADGAVDADGGADGDSDAAASWTVKANCPRSMSPSSADAEVHLMVYVPSGGGGWRDIPLAAVVSPVPIAAPSGPSSLNELLAGSRFSEKASLIVVGDASRTSPSAGSDATSSAWASAAPVPAMARSRAASAA